MKKFDYSFFALGTTCVISIVTEQEPPKNQLINELFEYVKDFEREFSRFKEDSDLMKLNTKKTFEVSNRFLRLLDRSREIFVVTE
jgi:thiamine biosynthesis lipoprotein ApbE